MTLTAGEAHILDRWLQKEPEHDEVRSMHQRMTEAVDEIDTWGSDDLTTEEWRKLFADAIEHLRDELARG